VKFCTYTLIDNSPDPISGVQLTPYERFQHVVRQAQWAEGLGFDGYGVGERHAQRFISSSPPVVLSYIAAVTSRIRLLTTVTVLSLLDPVRVAEDYATLDQLSGGRLDIIIAKGNAPDSPEGSAQPAAVRTLEEFLEGGLPEDENRASVESFVTEVMPVLRSSYPSRVWASAERR
jgi:alkanesulfonate monooxygenase SsuD/methylene tetrahydromethanopterin reductase-like flavin-dependent oxidoreductase (luciferase family)